VRSRLKGVTLWGFFIIFTERDGRKGPPAGNKAKCNRTNTPHSKATRRKAKPNQNPQTHTRGARQASTTSAEGRARPRIGARPEIFISVQRETEEKARQPETKLSAIAQTRHIAREFLYMSTTELSQPSPFLLGRGGGRT
jgi:hypothetical protein